VARALSPDDVAMTLQEQPTTSTDRIRRRGSPFRAARDLWATSRESGDVVDLALELLERHRLSPMELRILLAVRDGELSVSELAERFGSGSVRIRQSAGSLYARGLLHWRYAEAGEESMLSLTLAGRRIVRSLDAVPVSG
jgi:DNA-binding MarR family transcriptional regulator